MHVCAPLHAVARGGQKGASDFLGLSLQMIVSHLVGARIEPRSSKRAALNCS